MRRTGAGRRGAARRRLRRSIASERWLLLLVSVTLVVLAWSVLSDWPFGDEQRHRPERPSAAQARLSNAAVPIQPARRGRAEPFRFRGGAAAREQAAECLATAALYEAGDDRRGQRAVIQVILNRARQPGFPATICGVVYQGFARTTGCQFSFTCDGSFARRPIHRGWTTALTDARRALSGRVFAPVGTATHYHADWIVPYWRDSMIKVARVGAHLFYVRR